MTFRLWRCFHSNNMFASTKDKSRTSENLDNSFICEKDAIRTRPSSHSTEQDGQSILAMFQTIIYVGTGSLVNLSNF